MRPKAAENFGILIDFAMSGPPGGGGGPEQTRNFNPESRNFDFFNPVVMIEERNSQGCKKNVYTVSGELEKYLKTRNELNKMMQNTDLRMINDTKMMGI